MNISSSYRRLTRSLYKLLLLKSSVHLSRPSIKIEVGLREMSYENIIKTFQRKCFVLMTAPHRPTNQNDDIIAQNTNLRSWCHHDLVDAKLTDTQTSSNGHSIELQGRFQAISNQAIVQGIKTYRTQKAKKKKNYTRSN